MPNIAESLIPTFGGDTTLVTDQNGTPVFPQARIMEVEVRPVANTMKSPLETGATITDHIVFMPVEIELSLILQSEDYKDTYKEIIHYYSTATLLIVQCKAGIFTNQLIQAPPHKEDSDHYDAIVLSLRLTQVLIAQTVTTTQINAPNVPNTPRTAPTQIVPASPKNSTTVQRGTQNALPVPPNLDSMSRMQVKSYVEANGGFGTAGVFKGRP
jgi:hypothetical protein